LYSELEEHTSSEHEPPVIEDPQRRMQLQALDNEIEYNEALITEREGEIQEIEQGITELNEIFRDLGTLVNEQESGIRMYIPSYILLSFVQPLLTRYPHSQKVYMEMFSTLHRAHGMQPVNSLLQTVIKKMLARICVASY